MNEMRCLKSMGCFMKEIDLCIAPHDISDGIVFVVWNKPSNVSDTSANSSEYKIQRRVLGEIYDGY